MIVGITVTPKDDGYEIELVGDVVNMIALPDGSVPDPYKCSVKVVAGARNQRYLYLDYAAF